MRSFLLFILSGIGLTGHGAAHAEEPPPYLEKDMRELASAMNGLWDNDRQVFFAEESGADASTVAKRQSLKVETLGGKDPFHQRVRPVGANDPLSSFEIAYEIHPDDGTIVQTYQTGADAAEQKVVCSIAWRRTAGGFSGKAEEGDCKLIFQAGDVAPGRMTEAYLSDEEFWITTDRSKTIRLRRARIFRCWTAVLRGAHHGDSGEGMDSWYFKDDVEIHDQGGETVLLTDEIPTRQIRLKLRDVDWPYGTRRPSLTLYVYEGDSDRATSYAWTEGGGDRIGINLRWIQASCTREGVE